MSPVGVGAGKNIKNVTALINQSIFKCVFTNIGYFLKRHPVAVRDCPPKAGLNKKNERLFFSGTEFLAGHK